MSRAEDIRASVEQVARNARPPLPPLPLIDPGLWEGRRAPARRWVWHQWIPARQATYLTGAGAAGKSLFGQQLATHVAIGRPFLGVDTQREVALYLTCEDDAEELQRRQEAIIETLDISFVDLSGRLHLCTLVGGVGNELAAFDPSNRMETTPAWERLRTAVLEHRPGFICLDNVAHLFAGNENIRAHVAAFCGLLNGLAAEIGAAVLFIGHPNKAGAEFSGSTAWENQVRSRLFIETPQNDGVVFDPDLRTISRGKANYARKGETITFRWFRWAFVRDEDLPPAEANTIAAHTLAKADDERFLACLTKATAECRATSTSRSAANYAPRVFAAMISGKGVTAERYEAAMERLLGEGVILAGQPVYRRANRQWVTGVATAPTLAPTPHQAVHQGVPSESDEP